MAGAAGSAGVVQVHLEAAVQPLEGTLAQQGAEREHPPGADGRASGHVDGELVHQNQVDVLRHDEVEVVGAEIRQLQVPAALVDDLLGLLDGDAEAAVAGDDAAEGVAVREEVSLEVLADQLVAHSVGVRGIAQERVEVHLVPAHQEAVLLDGGLDAFGHPVLRLLDRFGCVGLRGVFVVDDVDGHADHAVTMRFGVHGGRDAVGVVVGLGRTSGDGLLVEADAGVVADDGQFGPFDAAGVVVVFAVGAGLGGNGGHAILFRFPIGTAA